MNKIYRGWKAQQKSLLVEMNSEEIQVYNRYRNELVNSEMFSTTLSKDDRRIIYAAYFSKGMLALGSNTPLSEESHRLLERFAGVFDGIYTRFLDLQKAEAQAREAQIELGLERVRARAMAMQKSEDLQSAVTTVFEEFYKLNLDVLRCGVGILNKESRTGTVWATSVSGDGAAVQISADENFDTHPLMKSIYNAWQKQEDLSYVLEGEELKDYYIAMDISELKLPKTQIMFSEVQLKTQYYYAAMFDAGGLYAFRDTTFTAEDIRIMKRFAGVLNLTYNRFLDLKQAEAQTREAKIEVALERVRSRAMAMQKSDELKDLIATVSFELGNLDFVLDRCFLMIFDHKTNDSTWWMSHPESPEPSGMYIKYHEHTPYLSYIKAWKERQKKWEYVLEGDVKRTWDEFLFNETELSKLPGQVAANMRGQEKVYFSSSFNNFGCLSLATLEPLSNELFEIMLRFAKVFDLTYTRFNDLKQAEAQAREATIEAAVERVRGKALAMQKSEDLHSVVVTLKKALMGLNIRGVTAVSMYLEQDDGSIRGLDLSSATAGEEEGSAFKMDVVFRLEDTDPELWIRRIWNGTEKYFVVEADEDDFKRIVKWLYTLDEKEAAVAERIIKEEGIKKAWLPTVKLEKGKLNIDLLEPPSQEIESILTKIGAAFDLAYRRFLDLQKAEAQTEQARKHLIQLEAEKNRVESALLELQATQTQLIQSEKMASLGELTAGIAHEIQNPLNFVNNFSEVNKELLVEMKEEIEKGNINEAKLLADDLIDNQEKINHHGKRADSIVKGMLQHSRSSSGKKEPTDINVLVDEYLRLCYHGLRAKDKAFNATMKTDFDATIEKINIVPQDVGRVILNLLTNAFYAAPLPHPEKIGINSGGFKDPNYKHEPTVTIKTSQNPPSGGRGAEVLISVSDNGPGIPQKILDKIFQPFFTTKPTGQGTGLGLSLSYDIVKAHGGELKVDTKEGEGSTFIIQLPK
jgi:signal transduction histidine kinase